MDRQTLLQNAFGAAPPAPPVTPLQPMAPAIMPPAPKPPKRSMDPYVTAKAQSLVWQNGQMPPPKPVRASQTDQGVTPAMKPTEGWGQV